MIKNTKYYSKKIGNLAKGCQLCVKGSKLVLFVTGLCPRACYYCPISDKKYKKDVIYADEWKVDNIDEIIREGELIKAEGAGITGGDPLVKLRRTCDCIESLKNRFGSKFHIHLYTSFDLVNSKTLKKLYDAGLDEIRFHANVDSNKLWGRIELAQEFDWDIGIEIPAIPGKLNEMKKLVDYFSDKIDFLNLNELEVADNKVSKLLKLGYKVKDKLSYGIKGSEEVALKLMDYIDKNYADANVHYCTAKLKDKVQLAERIKRRAKSVKQSFQKITSEGTLIHGVIYLEKPGFGYNKNINKGKKAKLAKLNKIKSRLVKKYKISKIVLDKQKPRLLTSVSLVKKLKKQIKEMGLVPAIVEEYPTYDQTEIEIEFL